MMGKCGIILAEINFKKSGDGPGNWLSVNNTKEDYMFRVAICDDQEIICTHIEDTILDYSKKTSTPIEVEVFYSGETLCSFIRKNHIFDLIILDIELDLIDGIEVGRKIREEMNDEITKLLYISGTQGYAMDLFENRPFNFLIKPLKEETIIKYLEKAIKLTDKGKRFFEFGTGRTFYKIPYEEIVYFESEDKKIRIITRNGTYEYYGKLSDIEKVVPGREFLLIHKSYIVNYLYVSESQYEKLYLTNGRELPISQPYRKNVRDILMKRRKGRQ